LVTLPVTTVCANTVTEILINSRQAETILEIAWLHFFIMQTLSI